MTTELNYVNYDFDDLVKQLEDQLKTGTAWKDTYQSSTGQMVIDLFAAIGNMVLYYIERRAEESYITTARHRSSVVNLVKLIGYEPKRKVSSSGVLTFYLDAANAYNIYIPKWTECQTSGGIKFVVSESAVILKGQTYLDVNAIQGEIKTYTASGDGTADQECLLEETNVENSVENDTLVVVVDGAVWTHVTSFLNSALDSTHYRIVNNLDSTVTIKFGNGVNGKKPEVGSVISITYILSDGLAGNVYSVGMITTINDTIYNSNSDVVSNIHVSNSAAIADPTSTESRLFLGGDDEEDIEEIRSEAPAVFATGDRAVTKEDFISIIKNISGVADANVWGELEEAEDAGTEADYEMLNKVKICMILQNWEVADATFKTTMSALLYDQSMIAVKYEYVDPVKLQIIAVFLSVVASADATLSTVQQNIETEVEALFTLGDTSKLGTAIRYSNIVRAVDALTDVEYHTMILQIEKELTPLYSSDYAFGEVLDATPIRTGSVYVYVDDVIVAVDNGSGAFTDTSSVYGISGAIEYTTGAIGVDITDLDSGSVVTVRYRQDNSAAGCENDIITDRFEICELSAVEINAIENISD